MANGNYQVIQFSNQIDHVAWKKVPHLKKNKNYHDLQVTKHVKAHYGGAILGKKMDYFLGIFWAIFL